MEYQVEKKRSVGFYLFLCFFHLLLKSVLFFFIIFVFCFLFLFLFLFLYIYIYIYRLLFNIKKREGGVVVFFRTWTVFVNGLVFVFLDPFFFIFGFFRVAFHFQHTVLCVCMCVCVSTAYLG